MKPFHPVLRGKLLTGEESLHLRADVAGGGGVEEASLDLLVARRTRSAAVTWHRFSTTARPMPVPEPPRRSLDVEVALRVWHSEPMALDPYRIPEVD